MPANQLLMLVGDYVEDYEVMVPFHGAADGGALSSCGLSQQRAGDSVCTAIHDFEGDQTYRETAATISR
jgi:protease I